MLSWDFVRSRLDSITPEKANEMLRRALEQSGVPYIKGGHKIRFEDISPFMEEHPLEYDASSIRDENDMTSIARLTMSQSFVNQSYRTMDDHSYTVNESPIRDHSTSIALIIENSLNLTAA